MKTLILLILFTFTLNASIAYSNNYRWLLHSTCLMQSPDTLLDGKRGNEIGNDSISENRINEETDNAFAEMESELDEMNGQLNETDTTKIRIGKMKLSIVDDGDDIIINKNDDWDDDDWDDDWTWKDDSDFNFPSKKRRNHFKPHWAGISLGLNNYVTSDFSTNLPSDGDPNTQLLAVNTNNSLEFNLNIAQFGVNLFNQNIGLASGLGFKWNNYKFRNTNTVLVSDSTPLYYYEDPDQRFRFSKLATCYLIVPILLEFQIHTQEEPIYFQVGVEGGLKLGAWTKMKGPNDQKHKDKSDFHTVPWDYRLTARVGYGHFGVFATYGMLSVFEEEKGPELHPVAIGMSLNF